jgi:hypothetical protein
MTIRHYPAKLGDRSGVVAKAFARESPSPPMKLSRNRLPRAQDEERMPPATALFGRVWIATNKCQTLTDVGRLIVEEI